MVINKLSIIIPVFNEIGTLGQVLELVEKVNLSPKKEVIIVDDCSTDGSREFIERLEGHKYKVLFNKRNVGKGASIISALNIVSGDYVIFQDADLEYDPNDYGQMVEEVIKNDAEVVFGSRYLKATFKTKYYLAGRILTFLVNFLFGGNLTDMNGCYKLIKTDLVKSFALKEKRFTFYEELTVKLLKEDIKIFEVPVSYKPRKRSEGKKIRFKDGVMAIFFLLSCKSKK